MSVKGHDLARLQKTLRVLRIKGNQLLLLQIGGQSLGSGSRTGKKQNPVSILFISFQVMYQCIKAVIIRSNALGIHLVPVGRLENRIL